ncbi:caspase family protein [Thermodesulfovibrio sp. 3907-1M]|uniref:Caspase family protein n=1 Tax=Thermodesulfovibrio autotrophicus TaxID=3118333 RepID=A0AAU8GXW5_9BACT
MQPVAILNFSQDGRYVLSGDQTGVNILKIWSIETGKLFKTFQFPQGISDMPTAAILLPDAKSLLAVFVDKIILFEIQTNQAIKIFKSEITADEIAIYPNSKYALLSSKFHRMIALIDLETGELLYKILPSWIVPISISSDLKNAAIINYDPYKGLDITLTLIDIKTGKTLWNYELSDTPTSTIISSELKIVLTTTENNFLHIIDLKTGKRIQLYKISDHSKLINAYGRYALIKTPNSIELLDIRSGSQLRKINSNEEINSISPDGKYFITSANNVYSSDNLEKKLQLQGQKFTKATFYKDYLLTGDEEGNIILWDIFSGKEVRKFSPLHARQQYVVKKFEKYLVAVASKKWVIWDIYNGSLITMTEFTDFIRPYVPKDAYNNEGLIVVSGEATSLNSIFKATVDDATGILSLRDAKTNSELAKFILFTDGEWIVITPEGYYNASPNGDKHLNVRIGNNVYGIENYRETFYRPDLVKLALSGGSLKDFKTLADVKQPPVVEIIDTPSTTEKDEIRVTVRLTDAGGGIGDVRLYLNETAVLVDSARGIKITPKPGEKAIYKTYIVKLLNGENIIKAVAFNGDNTMQSNPAVHKVVATLSIRKPSMYAVVIGINEYKNPKLQLRYAVADAKLFAESLKQVAKPLFEKVEVKLLATKEETTKENIKKTLEGMKTVNPEDVFVFYVASHGTVDEGEYFLITSNVGSLSTFRLKEDALTQTELKELIANVPSTKKLIVIDTCNAGKLGEALQMAMLTRGMSEETAMKILSRAVGSTILSASTSLQEAMEGYQGHGLFTYVLTEGLKGKADTDRDGFIRTLEIASYVDSEVPALAEKVFKRAQYPTATPSGQAFPICKVR